MSIYDHTYLVYCGGHLFRSALVNGVNEAIEKAIEFRFKEIPGADDESFDEYVGMLEDFKNDDFWREGGNIWETDWENGFVVVVKVETLLN